MKKICNACFLIFFIFLTACNYDANGSRFEDDEVEIPTFNFPENTSFKAKLSDYKLFEGPLSDLNPAPMVQVFQLSSTLFTDHSLKLRTLLLPSGTSATQIGGNLDFPNGTILSKTFFYPNSFENLEGDKRIIETRLLIKNNDLWNAATYLWNEEQTEANLITNGHTTLVSWQDQNGITQSTNYEVPSSNDCYTCHQLNNKVTPLGPTLINLNRNIYVEDQEVNQLIHFQETGVLNNVAISQVDTMVDYEDESVSLLDRGRAYLAINCSHCHQPGSWDATADRDFNFQYNIDLGRTGIRYSQDKILRAINDGTMPFIGTTMLDEEGIQLLTEFLHEVQ